MVKVIWNQQFINEIAGYIASGQTDEQIAEIVQLTPKAVACGRSKFREEISKYKDGKKKFINIGGEYRTREKSYNVRIYAVDAGGGYPVHGAFFDGEMWVNNSWTSIGEFETGTASALDIVPKNNRIVKTLWVWIHNDTTPEFFNHHSTAKAWLNVYGGCIVRIDVDCDDGEEK